MDRVHPGWRALVLVSGLCVACSAQAVSLQPVAGDPDRQGVRRIEPDHDGTGMERYPFGGGPVADRAPTETPVLASTYAAPVTDSHTAFGPKHPQGLRLTLDRALRNLEPGGRPSVDPELMEVLYARQSTADRRVDSLRLVVAGALGGVCCVHLADAEQAAGAGDPAEASGVAPKIGPQEDSGDSEQKTGRAEDELELEEMEVTEPAADEGFLFDSIRSNTRITQEELDRRQPESIFDVLQDVPGVSISGGPLVHGKQITIRGFQDTEDVLIKLDGAIKDFEKYRFGGGPFIEPELLKALDVRRGPSALFEGSGALGGTVVSRAGP